MIPYVIFFLRFGWAVAVIVRRRANDAERDSPLRGRAGRDLPLRGRCRTGFAFAWENHPRNSRFRPSNPRNCKSHLVPSEQPTQVAIPSGSAREGATRREGCNAERGRLSSGMTSASRLRRETPGQRSQPAPEKARDDGTELGDHTYMCSYLIGQTGTLPFILPRFRARTSMPLEAKG